MVLLVLLLQTRYYSEVVPDESLYIKSIPTAPFLLPILQSMNHHHRFLNEQHILLLSSIKTYTSQK